MVLDTNKPSIVSGGGLVRAREGARRPVLDELHHAEELPADGQG